MANIVAESKSKAARGRHAANSKTSKPVASLRLLHSTLGEPPFGAQTTGTWPTGHSYYGHKQIKIDPSVAHAAALALKRPLTGQRSVQIGVEKMGRHDGAKHTG